MWAHKLPCSTTRTNHWKSEFIYDGLSRRRIRKEYFWQSSAWVLSNEVRYVFDGSRIIQERNSWNLPQLAYTRGSDLSGSPEGAGGIGGLLAISQLTFIIPQHAYYHADGNGNVTMLINTQQLAVAAYRYEPFGALVSISGPWAELNRFRFSSKEEHVNSGLVLYEARAYEPILQRWLSRDPLGELGGLNLFGFVANAPIGRLDPLGLAWYDDFGSWAGNNINSAQNAVANQLGYFSIPINNALSVANMAAQTPALILGIGTASGTTGSYLDEPILQPLVTFGAGFGAWSADPTWENAAAAAADFSTFFGVLAGALKPLPSFNKPLVKPKSCPRPKPLPTSFEDIAANPTSLSGLSADDVAQILGEGWVKGNYGITGTGWKFTKGDKIVFYHEGGKHVGPYYGFSSGKTGKVKIVGPDYKPLPGDKAKIIPTNL